MVQAKKTKNNLLQQRLQTNDNTQPASPVPNLSAMKRHRATEDEAIPTYSQNDTTETKPSTTFNPPKTKPKKAEKKSLKDKVAPPATSFDLPEEDATSLDEFLDLETEKRWAKQAHNEIVGQRISKVVVVVLFALCLYMAFLIYGVSQTRYVYNDSGAITAEVLSVEDLRVLEQYESLSSYYLRTRILYEDVLTLDYELATNPDNSREVARKYLSLLDNVSKLSTDLSAAELDTEYTGIVQQMYELVYTHIAVYLQNMSGAISNNDSSKASQAVSGRAYIETMFSALTANMADLCTSTHGASNGDIYDWSPDAFISSLGGD